MIIFCRQQFMEFMQAQNISNFKGKKSYQIIDVLLWKVMQAATILALCVSDAKCYRGVFFLEKSLLEFCKHFNAAKE